MSQKARVLNPGEWLRVGRGRGRDFTGLESADIATLLQSLPASKGPYVLVAHELVGEGREYHSECTIVTPEDLDRLAERGVWQYFILSFQLSADLLTALPFVDTRTLAVNGAINLQFGRRTREGLQPTSLGIVDRVAKKTGETVRFDAYVEIFEAAVNTARRLQQDR